MTAPDKPELSNEEFIEKWRKYLQGDREDTGEQIIYNLRVLPEALDRLEASAVKIGQVNDFLKDTDKHAEFYFMHQDPKILQAELEAEGVDVEGAKKRILARLAEIKAGLPPTQGKPTPGQIGLVDGDKLIEKLTIESALTRETPEGKGWIEAMNAVKYWTRLGDFSVSGQGQEERDFNFKDALDSALFELLDKCRENCNHGCHTVDDDTAWDECPDHKFMTDEIDKLRKTNWPEVQAHYSKMADEIASADKAQD